MSSVGSVGSVEVTIRIRFNQDITPEEAKEFVSEMNYEIEDTTGKVSIADTEVVEFNDDSLVGDYLVGMDDCPPDNGEF